MTNLNNDRWFYLDKKHQTLGNFNSQQLLELYQRKVITNHSYVWKEGFEDWKRFKDVRPSIQTQELKIVEKHVQIKSVTKENDLKNSKLSNSKIVEKQELNNIDYTAPYRMNWISENHKQNVTSLTQQIAESLALQKKLESFRLSPNKPDGLIIGTGEADFTKDNVPYEFTYQNKTFQLIDVPGIEGNEGQYEQFVKKAVEKAHLVIYVNGTNKKPEEVTARKIKSYLNQYAKIYAICNLRGKADKYDSEIDELVSLKHSHKEMDDVFNQTLTVLNQAVGADLIDGGACVQGLIAFSSLAYDHSEGETTISSSRKDLIATQKSFMRDFSSLEKMKEFSQIGELEQKIISKFSTFEEDIIESNKNKIVRKIEQIKAVIQEQLNDHLKLQTKIKKELDVGRDSIYRALNDFESKLSNKSNNAVSSAFIKIADDGCVIIEKYFGNQEQISSNIEDIVDCETRNLFKQLDKIKTEESQYFQDDLQEIIQRIGRSIEQVQITNELECSQEQDLSIKFSSATTFDVKTIGKGLIEIGSMAALGASIGTAFPVIGNIVGGLLGGLLGLIKAGLDFFRSEKSKINKAQSKFRGNVENEQACFKSKLRDTLNETTSSVRGYVDVNIIEKIYIEYEKMRDIERILNEQVNKLSNLSNQIEGKGYGTI